MKKLLFSIICLMVVAGQAFSQANIAAARAMPVGSTVTIRGIATNGDELGIIRYIQDATGGIAAYGSSMSGVYRGDSVEVTGVTKNYNQLLELDPVTSVVGIAPGKPLPAPKIITPNQMNESYEGQIIEFKNVTFNLAGGTFAGNTNYNVTSGGQTAQVRVNNSSPLVGQLIPSGAVHVMGICSQYSYSSASTGYQMLLRDQNDIVPTSSVTFSSPVTLTDQTTTSLTLSWQTNVAGTTEIFYGSTPALEAGHMSAAGTGTEHSLNLTGLVPSQLVYVNAFTVAGSDTGSSGTKVFVTNSQSSGSMKVYFTRSVDNSVSTGTNAVSVVQCADDTCIAYINRAKYSIDLAIYNFTMNGISNIAAALNAASNRGVQIRVVADGSTSNDGLEQLNGTIRKIARPSGDGIMHNKFMVIDANSADPNDPIVWTGSMNWTNNNVNYDANNILFIQDKSLALIYKLEFEEMFGSTSTTPSTTMAKFGPNKSDNTPHQLNIGGKDIEVYFSPSDAVNTQLLAHLNTANNDLEVATMLMTRADVGTAIAARVTAGVNAGVIINDTSYQTYNTLKAALGDNYREYNESGILHDKYMIIDQSNPSSDPAVWTGSHNWSSSADQKNDENTLVIHDATVANLYFQDYTKRFSQASPIGTVHVLNLGPDQEACGGVQVIITAGNFLTYHWSTGEIGTNTVTVDSAGVGYGTKTIWCRVTDANGTQSDTIRVTFKDCAGINDLSTGFSYMTVYPNPSKGLFSVQIGSSRQENISLFLYSLDGRMIWNKESAIVQGENILSAGNNDLPSGMYLLRIKNSTGEISSRIIVR